MGVKIFLVTIAEQETIITIVIRFYNKVLKNNTDLPENKFKDNVKQILLSIGYHKVRSLSE